MNDFAQKIRLYKVKLDLSNKDLAERTGLPVTTISRICSGSTKSPTLNTVKLLAKALDCSVEEFTNLSCTLAILNAILYATDFFLFLQNLS